MLHSERCDRGLLSSSAVKRVDQPFGSVEEVQKVMNVFHNSFSSTHSPEDVVKTVTTSAKMDCPVSIQRTSVSTLSGFRLVQSLSESSDHSHKSISLHSPTSAVKARKRRLSVSSAPHNNSTASITTVTTSLVSSSNLPVCSSASLSSLLTGSTPQVRKPVDIVLKSPSKESVNTPHLKNGTSSCTTSPLTTLPPSSSSATKTVTFSLGNQQNLNLVRLTPVSLRSNLESKTANTPATEDEVKNLKSLVLLHLDLVQQQQNIIAEKDKLIAELRAESNTLRTRLERMDRRLSVAKTPKKQTAASTKSETTENILQSKESNDSAQATMKSSSQSKLKFSNHVSPTSTAKLNKKKKQLQTKSMGQTFQKRKAILKNKGKEVDSNKQIRQTKARVPTDKFLRIDEDYFTQQVREFIEPEEEAIRNCSSNQNIEVPSFRTHTYANLYSLEGIEDLHDHIFLKRHQKYEAEEKKRKRWDLQRQREQQLREKLQHQLAPAPKAAPASREKLLDHIFPQAEEVEYIELCDSLPVNVFGHPLPALPPSEFSLPWHSSVQMTKSGKHTKRCRK